MKLKLLICLTILGVNASAQEVLTRDDAMKLALQHNYDIQVAQKNIESAKNNTSIHNTGYLPTATASGAGQVTFNAGENRTVQGDQTFDPAAAYNYNASVGLNYVIFNGLGRMYNYKQLKEQHNLTELQAKQIIENTMTSFCVRMNCAYAARFRKVVRGHYTMLYPLVETDIVGIPILSTPYLLKSSYPTKTSLCWFSRLSIIMLLR